MATIGGEPSTISSDSPTVLTIKVLFAQRNSIREADRAVQQLIGA
jgi:hypothetical protein